MRGMILKYKIEDIDVYNCLIEQLFTHYSQYIEILPLDNKYFREFHDEIQELYVEVLHYRKKSIPLVSEPKSKKEIKDLIKNNKLSEVFEELLKVAENGNWHNDLINLNSQYNDYLKSKNIGTLNSEGQRAKNKITDGLLSIIDELYN